MKIMRHPPGQKKKYKKVCVILWWILTAACVPFLWTALCLLVNHGIEKLSIRGGFLLSQYRVHTGWETVSKWIGMLFFLEIILILYEKVGKKIVWFPKKWMKFVVIGILLLILSIGGGFFIEQQSRVLDFDKIRYGTVRQGGLWEGKFADIGEKNLGEEVALQVIMEQPEAIYLKGFIGSHYTGNGWTALENGEVYQNRQTFWTLEEKNFSYATQLGQVSSALLKRKSTEVAVNNCLASRKYVYVPYGMTGICKEAKIYGDQAAFAKGLQGMDSYRLQQKENVVADYLTMSAGVYDSEECEEYRKSEKIYNTYVYDTYTELSKDMREYLIQKTGYKPGEKRLSYEDANKRVMEYLEDALTYTTHTGTYDGSVDFVQDTLEQQKKGYDVHYATIATLLYRLYGIPARYVEGYIITKENIQSVDAYGQILVPVSNAHAWVEIYQDGVGFVPMEVLPEYQQQLNRPAAGKQGEEQKENGEKPGENPNEQEQYEKEEPDFGTNTKQPKKSDNWNWYFWVGVIVVLLFVIFGLWLYWKNRQVRKKDVIRIKIDKYAKKMAKRLKKYGIVMEQPRELWLDQLGQLGGKITVEEWDRWFEIVDRAKYSSLPVKEEELCYIKKVTKKQKIGKKGTRK